MEGGGGKNSKTAPFCKKGSFTWARKKREGYEPSRKVNTDRGRGNLENNKKTREERNGEDREYGSPESHMLLLKEDLHLLWGRQVMRKERSKLGRRAKKKTGIQHSKVQ